MKTTASVTKAYKSALASRRNAHAPYSKFKVGAALQIKGEADAIGGCNIENASYGGTMCAERVAIFSAIARHGNIQPEFMVIVTGEKDATVPCAFCLQVMAEFCSDGFKVYLGNEKALLKEYKLSELLPHAFRSFKADK